MIREADIDGDEGEGTGREGRCEERKERKRWAKDGKEKVGRLEGKQ